MGSQAADWQIDILFFHLGTKWERESLFDEFRIFGTTQSSKCGIALIAVLGIAVCIENNIVLGLSDEILYQKNMELTSSLPPYFNAMPKTLPLMLG